MNIEDTAAALSDDAVTPEVASEEPTPTVEDELSAVWDKMQSPEPEASEPETEEPEVEAIDSEADEETETDTTSESDETEAEAGDEDDDAEAEPDVEAPTELPKGVRDAWKDMPEAARDAVLESHRKLNRQLSEQGRLVQGIRPIQEVLQNAVQTMPALANMRPEQVAQEVMQLAQMSQNFSSKPVETMLQLIQQHRLEEPLRKALAGERPDQASMQNNQLRQEVQRLQRQLAQVSDPEYLREQVHQFTTQTQVEQSVSEFASKAEHWTDVEMHMPNAIQFVKASDPSASPQDVLSRAYELAVSQFVPNAKKAKPEETAEIKAVPAADPEKTQAARKAKSVNVKSTSTGRTRKLSEAEELAKVYDKAMNS